MIDYLSCAGWQHTGGIFTECLKNTVDCLVKIRPVFAKTDWLRIEDAAIACGAYQLNDGKKQKLW